MEVFKVLLDVLLRRRQSYRQVFSGPHGENVLADLRRFCRVSEPSFVPEDPYTTAFNEGRRDVWNRIQAHLHLTDEMIQQLEADSGEGSE